MKKIFLALFLAIASPLMANPTNNVWLPFQGGNLDTICRAIWRDYDQLFNTNTVINIKQGATGEIASKDMLDSSAVNRSICAPVAMILYNQYTMPDTKVYGDDLDTLIRVVRWPNVFYGPNRTPQARTLDELVTYLRSLKRPVNVGILAGTTRVLVQYIARTYNLEINVINFTNGPQMYPTLIDGSIDLALDSGGGVAVAEQGRFKILGYSAVTTIPRLQPAPNFAQANQELANIEAWLGIAVPKTTDPAIKAQLTRQLEQVVKQEKFRLFAESMVSTADGLTGPALQDVINRQRTTIKRYWK